ncbi:MULTISPECIES: hypothetical protein [unclassified Microcoleus]
MVGKLYNKISKMLGVSYCFCGVCKNAFKTQGIEGIKLGYKESQAYLTYPQKAGVIEGFKNKKISGDLDEIVTYLERPFGAIYKSKQSYD